MCAHRLSRPQPAEDSGGEQAVHQPVEVKLQRRAPRPAFPDGRVRLGADVAILQINGREAPATILVGRVDEPILGVEALEALGWSWIRTRNGSLPPGPFAVRLGGYR